MNKEQRRKMHEAINNLSHEEVRSIVRTAYPKATGEKMDELAKKIVSLAHEKISPSKKPAKKLL